MRDKVVYWHAPLLWPLLPLHPQRRLNKSGYQKGDNAIKWGTMERERGGEPLLLLLLLLLAQGGEALLVPDVGGLDIGHMRVGVVLQEAPLDAVHLVRQLL